MMKIPVKALALVVILLCSAAAHAAETRNTGPWDLARLHQAPKAEWGAKEGVLQEVYFTGEPYRGQATRVFAYYARPEGEGPFPAMVLLHGGGGKAFPEWAKLWAERGYVALAIDLAGKGPDGKRLPDGGPDQDDKSKFGEFTDATARDMWTYHAVADAVLGHSLLAAQKEVDPKRIGVTGISWGGYLTCIVAGVDERFKVAVPVYGCGFIHENSVWVDGYFKKMDDEQRARWVKHFDPSSYLANVSCPILFVNGTNDFAYPPDSYARSYKLVPEELRTMRITVNMPHGHQAGWEPKEIGRFVDSILKDGAPLAKLRAATTSQQTASAAALSASLETGKLHYTTDKGPWQKRTWQSVDAKVSRDKKLFQLDAPLPKGAEVTYFFTARDAEGNIISSDFGGMLK